MRLPWTAWHNVFLLFIGAVSCTSQATVRLQPQDLAELKVTEPVYAVHVEHAPLFIGNPMGGLLGFVISGAIGQSRGDGVTQENQLKDPVFILKEQFLADLALNHGVKNVKVLDEPQPDDNIETLRSALRRGSVLEFKTIASGLSHPNGWTFYYAYAYYAKARLLRLTEGKVLWQSTCSCEGKTRDWMGTFTANGAKLLKAEMETTAKACAKQLLEHFSGKSTAR